MRKWGWRRVSDLPGNPHDGAGAIVLPPHHAPQPQPHTHAHSHHHHQQMILGDSSGGDEDHEVEVEIKAPKKRAETWVQDESRDVGPSRSRTSTCRSRFHRRWEKKGSIDHPPCAPISGGTCLKSSRRQSTRGRKKKNNTERMNTKRKNGGRRN